MFQCVIVVKIVIVDWLNLNSKTDAVNYRIESNNFGYFVDFDYSDCFDD